MATKEAFPVTVEDIIRYENGEMESEEEVIAFFQKLIDSGWAWRLQGSYGRAANDFINSGKCRHAEWRKTPQTYKPR